MNDLLHHVAQIAQDGEPPRIAHGAADRAAVAVSRALIQLQLRPPPAISRSRKAQQRQIRDDDLPYIEALGDELASYQSSDGNKLAGALVYERAGHAPTSVLLGPFDHSYAAVRGKYTRYAYEIDKKRAHDGEPKLLDAVLGELALVGSQSPIARATLHLRGNRGPCTCCQGVIEKFQEDHPFVEVRYYYAQAKKLEDSHIESSAGKGVYQNGYSGARAARREHRGERDGAPLDRLWYKHLQSLRDRWNQLDPEAQDHQRQQAQQLGAQRAQLVGKLQSAADSLFRHQTTCQQLAETHVFEARKSHAIGRTYNSYRVSVKLPVEPALTEIHRGLIVHRWQASGGEVTGEKLRVTAVILYPGPASYDACRDQVHAAIEAAPGNDFVYQPEHRRLDPDPRALREQFAHRLAGYVAEIGAGQRDDVVRQLASSGRLDFGWLPSFIG